MDWQPPRCITEKMFSWWKSSNDSEEVNQSAAEELINEATNNKPNTDKTSTEIINTEASTETTPAQPPDNLIAKKTNEMPPPPSFPARTCLTHGQATLHNAPVLDAKKWL